jgi:hypothetical protein
MLPGWGKCPVGFEDFLRPKEPTRENRQGWYSRSHLCCASVCLSGIDSAGKLPSISLAPIKWCACSANTRKPSSEASSTVQRSSPTEWSSTILSSRAEWRLHYRSLATRPSRPGRDRHLQVAQAHLLAGIFFIHFRASRARAGALVCWRNWSRSITSGGAGGPDSPGRIATPAKCSPPCR